MNQLEKITNLFETQCNYTHTHCKEIANKISDYHGKGLKVTNDFFSSYLLYLDNGIRFYYDKCSNRKDICIPVIMVMLTYIVPTEDDLLKIMGFYAITEHNYGHNIKTNTFNELSQQQIYKILIDRKIKLPTSMLHMVLKNKNINGALLLINYINPDAKCLEEACSCYISDQLIQLVHLILSQKIPITITAIKNSIISHNTSVFNILLQYGVSPDIECLIEACRIIDIDMINKILMYKVTPTTACFDALLSTCYLGYGKYKESQHAKKVAGIIDILIGFGYVLTYDDVYNALLKGCYVNDISRFNIKFDSKFLEACTKHSFYPYNNIGVKATMECLYIESKRINNVQNIKKLISEGLKPDVECLVQACDNKTNIQNIRFLVEAQGIKPNLKCLKALSRHIGNSTLTYLLNNMDLEDDEGDEYDKFNKYNIQNKQNNTQYVNNDINDNKNMISNNMMEDNIPEIDEAAIESKKKFEARKLMDQRLEELNDVINELKDRLNDKKKGKKLNVIVDDSDDSDDDKTKHVKEKIYDIVSVKSTKAKLVNAKDKYSPNTASIKLFNLTKTDKFTIYETRKLLLDYIAKHKLVDSKQRNLIKVNDDLSKLLRLKIGQYIDFSDIDHIACKMLKI